MGCDIHFYVERREDGVWKTADTWVTEEYGKCVPYKKAFYSGRNYDLFSILADVRNGYGFAGIPTGRGFIPIDLPRGIPEDASHEYRTITENWGGDGHSHSYFTVAELLAYDWSQVTQKTGVVDLKNWAIWKLEGAPREWSGDVSGFGIVKVEVGKLDYPNVHHLIWGGEKAEGARQTIHNYLSIPLDKKIYTQVEWEVSYYSAAKDFLSATMPRLWRLGRPDDVRIVFFFDN